MADASGFTVDVGFVRQASGDVQGALEPMGAFVEQRQALSDALRSGVGEDPGPDVGPAPEVAHGHWAPAPAAPITGASVNGQMQQVLETTANAMTGLVLMGEQIRSALDMTADNYERNEQLVKNALAPTGGQWHAPMLPTDQLAQQQGKQIDLTAPPAPAQIDLTAPSPSPSPSPGQ